MTSEIDALWGELSDEEKDRALSIFRAGGRHLSALSIALALIDKHVLKSGDIVRWIDVLILGMSDYHDEPKIRLAEMSPLLDLRDQLEPHFSNRTPGEYRAAPHVQELIDQLRSLQASELSE